MSNGTTDAGDDDSPTPAPWSRARRDLAIVLWPSFLAAAVATMFFFAVFDPVDIGDGTALATLIANHNAGYALGFFFFWAFTTLSSALTVYLLRTESSEPPADAGSPRGAAR
jgi:hypothetical protein